MFVRRGHVYHPAVGPVAFIFASNDSLAERVFLGVAEGDLWKRPTPQSNPMLWILGHMAETRARLLKALGDDYSTGWGDAFGRGAVLQETAGYPSREKIHDVSREVNRRLFAKLAALTDADLVPQAKGPRPNTVQTIGDQIAFLAMHDSYHVGQLAYARKALGHAGVVG